MANSTNPSTPRQVIWALGLFWLTIGLAVAKLVISLATPAAGHHHGVVIVSFLIIYGLMALAIVYIQQGTGWARGVMLTLFLLGIAPSLPIAFEHFGRFPVAATLTLAQGVAQLGGFYLVYGNPGNAWFRRPATG